LAGRRVARPRRIDVEWRTAMAILEDVSFDGFEGRLARPEQQPASPLPGVLVMPDAFGMGAGIGVTAS
jgi:dienelactone hydrolase